MLPMMPAVLAIVQIHSALDDFSTALRAEHSRWCAIAGMTCLPVRHQSADAEDEPLWKICQDLGLQSTSIVAWRPLLALFRVMRNCIAHSSGRASAHLAALASSPALAQNPTKLAETCWRKATPSSQRY